MFEIVVAGSSNPGVHPRLQDLVGGTAVTIDVDRLVVSARDQAALLGVLNLLNDLGYRIHGVNRTA